MVGSMFEIVFFSKEEEKKEKKKKRREREQLVEIVSYVKMLMCKLIKFKVVWSSVGLSQ